MTPHTPPRTQNWHPVWLQQEKERLRNNHFPLDEEVGVVIKADFLEEVRFALHLEAWEEFFRGMRSGAATPGRKNSLGRLG